MKSIINLIIGAAIVVILMMFTGMINKDQLLDLFAGEIEMGETKTSYKEEDFINVFDVILGEMAVSDTSRTEFKRSRGFGCESAYVVTETQATIKYEVKSNPDLFYVDVENKTYYVSDDLGVSYHEADRKQRTSVEESNCIKEKNLRPEDIERSKNIAERNFTKSIETSEKWQDAQARFVIVKTQLLDKLVDAGFNEEPPTEEFLD
ncbi:MAG: hypothetical protein AB8G11_24160 [Saprospiraceae bacterium]